MVKSTYRSRGLNTNSTSKVDTFSIVRFENLYKDDRVPICSPSVVISDTPFDPKVDYVRVSSGESLEIANDYPLRSNFITPQSTCTCEELKQFCSILAYDDEWQINEKTEQLAFSQAVKLLPGVPGVIYFGFPWATLINHLQSNRPREKRLTTILERAKPLLKEKKQVITVCQHIDLPKYQDIFADVGVTHVFSPHACEGQNLCPKYRDIKVSPFPFASVLLLECPLSGTVGKKYLYSFAKYDSKDAHISQACDLILDHLGSDQRGLIISRDQWGFGKIILDHISAEAGARQEGTYGVAPIESRRILQESVFSLCPSGLGSNSVRLWESIGFGSIPVLFHDSHILPGSKALWDQATVSCSERPEEIQALPDLLETLTRDQALLERKRQALHQLWLLYGPDCLIYDIQKLFLTLAQENFDMGNARPGLSYGKLLNLAAAINQRKNVQESERDLFILGCSSRVLSDPTGFLNCYEENAEFHVAYKEAISSCNRRYSEAMLRNIQFRGISLK